MGKPERIYLAGPMTGYPGHNFDAFHRAAQRLKAAEWDVVNPAENFGGRTDLPRADYMRADVAALVECDAIALLPGWQESRGAKAEYLLAREMGLKTIDVAMLAPLIGAPDARVELTAVCDGSPPSSEGTTESILDEAKGPTNGSRQADYGHPRDDFARTALMWNGILAAKLRDGAAITATDVPLCLIAVKLARQAHRHKRDNLVDIAGYARTAAMVTGEE
jgi:hypothetical protein